VLNNNEFITQGRSLPFIDTDVVPLGFKPDSAGAFTLAFSNFDGLFAGNQAIYLKDNATSGWHNLKVADSFQLQSEYSRIVLRCIILNLCLK